MTTLQSSQYCFIDYTPLNASDYVKMLIPRQEDSHDTREPFLGLCEVYYSVDEVFNCSYKAPQAFRNKFISSAMLQVPPANRQSTSMLL